MTAMYWISACVAQRRMLLGLGLLVAGCTAPGGGGSSTDEVGRGLGATCGSRSVSSVPAPGTVRETVTTRVTTEPAESALGQVVGLFGGLDCGFSLTDFESPGVEYQVGEDGRIVGVDLRFVVYDRCLIQQSEMEVEVDEDEDEDEESIPEEFDESTYTPENGPCDEGSFPLGPNGAGDTSPGFICVTAESDLCIDCREEGEAWVQVYTLETTYQARGSLAAVTVFDFCNGGTTPTQVAIEQGDRVTVTLVFETRYDPVGVAP